VANDTFLVYNLLFYQCISDVLIVMFFCDMCSCAFICLVLLISSGWVPILVFFIYKGFSFHTVLWLGYMAWTFDFAHKSYFNVEFEIPTNIFFVAKFCQMVK